MIYCITGGTGSLGRALIRHLLASKQPPDEIRIVARNEHRLQDTAKLDPRIKIYMGDVRDKAVLLRAFKGAYGVFHAAAQKAIDLAEVEGRECWTTNVAGTDNACQAAIQCGVRNLLVVSSDKSVNPMVTYGAAKCLAEHLAINYGLHQTHTSISCVRYGNVLASQGSVLVIWRKQAEENKPLTVTQRGMTRFYISLLAAAHFVATAMRYMRGGEIFTPKMKSLGIEQLVAWLHPKRKVKYIGLRSSEKIHETLISADEVRRSTDVGFAYIVWPVLSPSALYGMAPKWTAEQLMFGYTSRNAQRLSKPELLRMLKENGK